jgi:hypothetical protein
VRESVSETNRRLILASRELIITSRRCNERSRRAINGSRRLCPRRFAGGSDQPSATPLKAPGCTHQYVTIEVGRDRDWAVREAESVAGSMVGFYVSAPYKDDGHPWKIAVCLDCAHGHRAT